MQVERGVGWVFSQRVRWQKTSVKTFSHRFFKTLTEGTATTAAGSLFQYFTTTPYTMSYQRQGRTPPFQAASLEDWRISELCLPGVIATPGRQKRRAEPLLTESVLNPYVLIPLPELYYYPSFYHLKFIEEAENCGFVVEENAWQMMLIRAG